MSNNKIITISEHRGFEKTERGNDIMTKFKPIQATPELSGEDALNFINQAFKQPSQNEIDKNKKLVCVLNKIRG